MSSILKALKKLEAEKARTPGRQIDLARDILSPTEVRRSSPLKLPLLVLSLVLLGGLLGMAMLVWFAPGEPLSTTASSEPAETLRDPAPVVQERPAGTPPATAVSRAPNPPLAASNSLPAALPTAGENPFRPRLVVSGIVYQQDPESRMAVVNDLPIMVGTSIEGALVEEIRPASVVFRYEDQRFEVWFRE